MKALSQFKFVVARFDRDPNLTFQAYFYDESPKSQPITINGRSGIALGLNSPWSVKRARQEGWTEVTETVNIIANSEPIKFGEDDGTIVISDKPKSKKPKPRARTKARTGKGKK